MICLPLRLDPATAARVFAAQEWQGRYVHSTMLYANDADQELWDDAA